MRTTLSHNKDYHLYKECFDKNLVYLQLDNPISTQREQDPNWDHDELMNNKITQNNTSEQDKVLHEAGKEE